MVSRGVVGEASKGANTELLCVGEDQVVQGRERGRVKREELSHCLWLDLRHLAEKLCP